jgi:hypothetical protein
VSRYFAILLFLGAILLMQGPASNQALAAPGILSISVLPISHLSGCVAVGEIARGDSLPFLINVTYSATGKPMSNGTVKIQLSNGASLKARYSSGEKYWSTAYPIPWNASTGPLGYTVTATDNVSNTVVFTPISPYGLVQIVPANLYVNATIEDAATNTSLSTVSTGQTVRVVAFVAYPLPGQGFPTQKSGEPPTVAGAGLLLNNTLLANATAVIGTGTFNSTGGTFSQYTAAKVPLAFDSKSQSWTGKYTFNSSEPTGFYQAAVMAQDKASPSNQGYSVSSVVEFGVIPQNVIDSSTVAFLAAGVLVVGLIAGTVFRPRLAKSPKT